tara:strand:- start:233 stop:475 length:243 start_codon:yes stop_codon:yes gene_type:complete
MSLTEFYILLHDPIWTVLLSAVLFLPIRQLIWVLYVRKQQKIKKDVSDEEKKSLKKRATVTATLLCIVFSYIYVKQMFNL